MDPWRRKRRPFDNEGFFEGLEEEFRKMEERLNEIFDEIPGIESGIMEQEPYIYGFSIRTGPGGKPTINEFGNIKKIGMEKDLFEGREPLIDIIEGKKELTIVAELPGVEKEDIILRLEDNTLIIDVDGEERRYHKRLPLPANVEEGDMTYTYKNGILEVKLKRG
ncbi:MAG: heat-shock protein Hsp20 [Candidatus Altiarchaeales archaeon ex4484_2]|nr:MAG: heat-shock protein Hsp20 [Candidatus Altiarchaeales archaeon ex4484_2]